MSFRRASVAAAVLGLFAPAVTYPAPAAMADDVTYNLTATINDVHTGVAIGTVDYSQTGRIETVHITVQNVAPNSPYWVANYGNRECAPNANTPSSGTPSFGIVLTDADGTATFDRTVRTDAYVIENSKSVSIRRGDNSTDIDGDGVTGWKDEVGVDHHPLRGLLGCDRTPVHS